MVLIDRPPAPPAAPARHNRIVSALTVIAALLAIDGAVPWQRWCHHGSDAFPSMCFDSGLWSGSASLVGLGAETFAVLFLAMSVLRRWPQTGRLPLTGTAIGAAFLAAAWVKITLVLDDGARTASVSALLAPYAAGLFIGVVVGALGALLLLGAIAGGKRIAVAAGTMLAVTGVTIALTIPYASSGLAWWGGPLADPMFLGRGNAGGVTVPPNRPVLFDALLSIHNAGKVTATLEGLDLVGADPNIRVRAEYAVSFGRCGSKVVRPRPAGVPPGECVYPIGGVRLEPGSERRLGLLFEARSNGLFRTGWFRIRYRVGPIHYEVFRTDELTVCAPEAGRKSCPGFFLP